MGDGLPVDEIESKLGITRSNVGKKGEHVHGDPKYAILKTNIWGWNSPASSDVRLGSKFWICLKF